jgi:acyl-CoA dehydrogenase
MGHHDARVPLQSFSIWMLGPAAATYAKLQYLPPIARGEVRWCQGYSGRARAAISQCADPARTRAILAVVGGQKIWTSVPTRLTRSLRWCAGP